MVKKALPEPRDFDWRELPDFLQLVLQGTQGVTEIVEGSVQAVWHQLGRRNTQNPQRTRGITRTVFRSIQGVTSLLNATAKLAASAMKPAKNIDPTEQPTFSLRRLNIQAALNGVIGDRLEAQQHAFAWPMRFSWRRGAEPTVAWRAETSPPDAFAPDEKCALVLHGLCMHDGQWPDSQDSARPGHLSALREAGYQVILVRYNSGCSIEENGIRLALSVQILQRARPQLKELMILSHSMGGLVTRHAVAHAQRQRMAWLKLMRGVVFLGTPHQGAALEKMGGWLEQRMRLLRYTLPYTRLTGLRSRGILDLGVGISGPEVALPRWPKTVQRYAVAGVLSADQTKAHTLSAIRKQLDASVGDGLVSVASAFAQHAAPSRPKGIRRNATPDFSFTAENRYLAHGSGHLELLTRADISAQIAVWLKR